MYSAGRFVWQYESLLRRLAASIGSVAAAPVVVAAAAAVAVAAAVAAAEHQQQNDDDDPAAVAAKEAVVIAHKKNLQRDCRLTDQPQSIVCRRSPLVSGHRSGIQRSGGGSVIFLDKDTFGNELVLQ